MTISLLYYDPALMHSPYEGAYTARWPSGIGLDDFLPITWDRGLRIPGPVSDPVSFLDMPSVTAASADGVPWEIHRIEDDTARHAARHAWRESGFAQTTVRVIRTLPSETFSSWFPCWKAWSEIRHWDVGVYYVDIDLSLEDPSEARITRYAKL